MKIKKKYKFCYLDGAVAVPHGNKSYFLPVKTVKEESLIFSISGSIKM